jgi:hypothetical protein
MTRERPLWQPGNNKKLSFESPEVMLEEKSALHFSIMKQEAAEVAAIWAALHLDRLFDAEIMQWQMQGLPYANTYGIPGNSG